MTSYRIVVRAISCLLVLQIVVSAQTPASTNKKPAAKKTAAERSAEKLAESRRTMASSLLVSLADEAKSFRDLALRARIQARSADTMWDVDPENARNWFKRAWDSAEAADEENARLSAEERNARAVSRGTTARRQQPSTRHEVLRLAARHDRELGEEFLKKLEEARKEELEKAPNAQANQGTPRINPDDPPQAMAQRLNLARQLLDEGDVERALQFADTALYPVNTLGMNILDTLHAKNAAAADQRYFTLLGLAMNDPVSDANTISLLSSYLFTPFMYITVRPDGNSHTRRWSDKNAAREDVAASVQTAFFRTAATVLLGPVAEPDLSSSGRLGSYVVITRLLPLFEKFGNDQAPALRARLGMLMNDVPERMRQMDDPIFTRGLVPEDKNKDHVQDALDRLPRAKNSDERDRIYFQAAMAAGKDYERARQLADKVEEPELRKQLSAYLTFDAMRQAIEDKQPDEALRFVRSQELTTVQRAWALTEVGRLLAQTDRDRAAEMLDQAGVEANRIEQSSPDRVRTQVAIVTQFQKVDSARAWEMMADVIKSANVLSGFSGEDGEMTLRVVFKNGGAMTNNFTVGSFDLTGLFSALAAEDFDRAVDLPKRFTGDSPRALAVLAIARTVLKKQNPSK